MESLCVGRLMIQNTTTSIWRSLVLTIIPLFFGSLLFGGILESYKNDATARKEIMTDFYRPMRETQAECNKTHNNLFLKYGEVSGSYQLMLEEFNHLTTTDPAKMTKEYQILLESMLSTHTKVNTEAKDLESKLEQCRTKLFRQYGELALVTGTYAKYLELSKDRASRLNELHAARKAASEKMLKNYDISNLRDVVRNFLQVTFETQEKKNAAAQKINELVTPIIQHYLQLSANEQEMFKVDTKFFEDLNNIYSAEINDRFERGFIARHFF